MINKDHFVQICVGYPGIHLWAKIPGEELKKWRSKHYPKLKMEFEVHVVIRNEGQLKLGAD